jgi:hypothetical protein
MAQTGALAARCQGEVTDGAIDVFLPILTNGKVTRDKVGYHADLLGSFPYVGAPHKVRSAQVVAA